MVQRDGGFAPRQRRDREMHFIAVPALLSRQPESGHARGAKLLERSRGDVVPLADIVHEDHAGVMARRSPQEIAHG